jgi:hypothetical protein
VSRQMGGLLGVGGGYGGLTGHMMGKDGDMNLGHRQGPPVCVSTCHIDQLLV